MAGSYEILDPRFSRLFNGTAQVEKLFTGCRWAEGPAYFAAGRYLVWSDIPNDRMMRYDETDGSVSVFRQPAGNTNGNTVDRQGRLVTCEHGGRRVSRTEHDGAVTTVASHWRGKRLNSPNDVVVKSDGSIWFTDPPFGLLGDYEGRRADAERNARRVVLIQTREGSGLVNFYAGMLAALEAPQIKARDTSAKAEQLDHLLRQLKPRVMIFDEFHNCLRGRCRDIEAIFAVLRRFGRDYDLSPVLVGELAIFDHIMLTAEMASRFQLAPVPRWSRAS